MAASSASWPVDGIVERVDARGLHGGDGPAGGAVVGVVGAHEAVLAELGDGLVHLALRLGRLPVGRVVLGADLHLALVEHRVRALLEELGVVVGRGAVDHHDGAAIGLGAELLDQRVGLQLTDLGVVVGVVVSDALAGDLPVVGEHRDVLGLGLGDDRPGGGGVNRVQHHHLCPVGQRRLGLLLLLGGVLVGVRVQDLAVRAELLDLGLEQRAVLRLIPGVLRLGQKQGDLAAAAGGGARRVAARSRVVVVAAARAQTERDAARDDDGQAHPAGGPTDHVRPPSSWPGEDPGPVRKPAPRADRRPTLCNDRHDVTRSRSRRRCGGRPR